MAIDIKTIETMAAAGINFVVNISVPGGGKDIELKPKDIPVYIADEEQCAADHFGVSKPQYLAWIEHEGRARCGGMTSNGKRCRNYVSGHIQLPIYEWLRRDGGYCVAHGGEGSVEARARGFGHR